MEQATSSFVIDRWEEAVALDEPGAKWVRTSIGKTFSGDLVGTSVGEMIMGQAGASRAYLGFERFEVRLKGRAGKFVLRHTAEMGGDAVWKILPGTGSGELEGLSGTATIVRRDDGTHTFTLDYTLG